MIHTQELVIILIIVIVLFGAKRLPEIGRGIGEAIKNFKKSVTDSHVDTNTKNENTEKK